MLLAPAPSARPFTRRPQAQRLRPVMAAAAAAGGEQAGQRWVKVCGVTNPRDAAHAAAAGANLVGMILWPRAKRSIPADVARQVADAARAGGAEPVGVFVDEDAATIAAVCEAAGVRIAQLHGDGARAAALDLPHSLEVVYVMHAAPDGRIVTPLPAGPVQWVVLDSLQGGSGEAFDWAAVRPPAGVATRGWLLAGGLSPDNVSEAVRLARPLGVDVSSGVCGPDMLLKDPARVETFVTGAWAALGA